MREQEQSTEMYPTGLHSGCGPWRTRPGGCGLAWPPSPLRGLPCQSPRIRSRACSVDPCPGAEPACCTHSSVNHALLGALGPPSFGLTASNSVTTQGSSADPGFGCSPSCLHGNAGSWLISIFNLVPSSECPASSRRPGVLTGTLLDMTLYFHGHFSGV